MQMRTKILWIAVATALLAALGCGGAATNGATGTPTPTGSNTGTPTPTGPTPTPTPDAVTISQIRHGTVPQNTTVTITNVVVTGVQSTPTGVNFFAQDAGGGQYSGIFVYDKGGVTPTTLAVGDTVTVTGAYSEYAGPASSPWPSPHTQSEIVPSSVTQSGTASPHVDVIDSSNLASINDTTGEPWESCLIQIGGTAPKVVSVGGGHDEFYVQGSGTDQILVGAKMYDAFEQALVNETVTSLTGVLVDEYKHYQIDPRTSADLTLNGTNTAKSTTISSIMGGSVTSGQLVTLSNVYVTAVAPYTSTSGSTQRAFWVSTSTTQATNGSIYVEDPYYTNPNVAVGNKIASLQGKLIVYGFTHLSHSIQIGFGDLTAPSGSGSSTITPLTVSLSTLNQAGTTSSIGPYEGVLVKVSDSGMKVQSAPNAFKEYTVGTSTTSFFTVGSMAFDSTAGQTVAAGNAVVSVIGPVYLAYGNHYLEPRSATDVQW